MNKQDHDDLDITARSCSLAKIQNNHKVVLALSTLTLGISLVFILYIASLDKLKEISFLQLAQLMLLLAIITAFGSFFTNKKTNCVPIKYSNKALTVAKLVHYASVVFLIAGVVCTAIFIYSNIHMR
ncbi:MAG: hypothetical protein R3331_04050 [Sulfurospirillaceae bacterium]|nr:hypothetical protein [Sulfurospirillaceae bacterium]